MKKLVMGVVLAGTLLTSASGTALAFNPQPDPPGHDRQCEQFVEKSRTATFEQQRVHFADKAVVACELAGVPGGE